MTSIIERPHSEALVLITGITANAIDKQHLLEYFRSHTDYQVFLPTLGQYFGIRFAAWRLNAFLRHRQIDSFSRCHVICYISGGFILRHALASRSLSNLGRVILVRSPLQEQVPKRSLLRYGRLLPLLLHGKMLLDLAADWKDTLPDIAADTGYVIEHGLSKLAGKLGLKPCDFARYRHDQGFSIEDNRPILNTPLSHDEVYCDDGLLAQMAHFIATGQFPTP